jgi:hypothetical protein
VDHVEAEDERDVEARAFDGRALEVVGVARAADAERGAEEAAAREVVDVRVGVAVNVSAELLQLPELLFERHAREQRVHLALGVVLRAPSRGRGAAALRLRAGGQRRQ